jgi:hypothetical protein
VAAKRAFAEKGAGVGLELLYERDKNLARAIADWGRSLDRLPANNPAEQKLIQYAAQHCDEAGRYQWVFAYSVCGLLDSVSRPTHGLPAQRSSER